MQGFRQIGAVQRLHFSGVARGVLGLVGLQMPDQHPLQALPGQRGRLLPDFLGLVFAEAGQAQRHGFADCVHLEGLADGQQHHAVRAAPGARAGVGNALADVGDAPGHGVYDGHAALLQEQDVP
ncbi:hypothetical protein D3C71_1483280 [compost metagenome]